MKKLGSFIALVALGFFLSTTTALAGNIDDLVKDCAACHGKDGASTESDIPIIGGMSAQYFTDTAEIYKDGDRPCAEVEYPAGSGKSGKNDMCKIFDDIGDDDIQALADYYAEKPFVRAQQEFDASQVKKGSDVHEDLCEKCHGSGGSSASDDSGILAGQWKPYLKATLDQYISGDRKMGKKMKKKFKKLQDGDVEALIEFYISDI